MTKENQHEAEEPLETLHVERPFFYARYRPLLIVTDTKGYTVVIARPPSGLRDDIINDPQGNQLCALDAHVAKELIPREMHIGEFGYDFEAPLGTIPNLCKKAGIAK